MKVAGYDLSMNGSGICILDLDENLDVVDCDYLGFTQVKKYEIEGHSIYYRKDDFDSRYALTEMMIDEITKKTKDVSYAGIEDFAFGALGRLADIGSFVGQVAYDSWKRGIALKWYGPAINKKFFTGKGTADKIGMYNTFLEFDGIKPDISYMPEPKDKGGVSPTSDIIDAFSLAKLLQTELKIRKGILKIGELPKYRQELFYQKKKKTLLDEDFVKHSQVG